MKKNEDNQLTRCGCLMNSKELDQVSEMITRNVGSVDRMARAIGGGGLAIVELTGNLGDIEQYFHYFAIATSIWLVATATSGKCPAYSLMKVSTCSAGPIEEE
ncbi:MAG: DUF2892 domain-containing protein [Candidatus Poseidoniaceae archaeon]|jgi:hypothetical protein|nr:DUF2892 domain-containing protein [Candidatus Poseidoniaceae archaeon]